MFLEVARVPPEGLALSGEIPLEELDVEARENEVQPVEALRYDVRAAVTSGRLVLRGTLKCRIACVCARCGKAFASEAFDDGFAATYELQDGSESVDLTPEMRESIILRFPSYPLCHRGCKGVCGRCGADWNRTKCRCRSPRDGGWTALEQLDLGQS